MRRLAGILRRLVLAASLLAGLTACSPLVIATPDGPRAAPTVATVSPTSATPAVPVPLVLSGTDAPTAVEVFRSVAPGVAFVDTPTGTGSGLLIDGGFVLTNAHVVWPFDEARVVFPDGLSWDRAPVFSWDLLVDLALLGPLEVTAPALALTSGEDIAVADAVYLIGYPGEVEPYPQPAISGGLISRYRQWEQMHISYFQVDATIAGGQSGGALVSRDGRVIGVSGFLFADTYGLIASAEDLAPHVQRLLTEGQHRESVGVWLPRGEGSTRLTLTLDNLWDTRMYVIGEQPGTAVRFEVEGANDAYIELLDAYGASLILVDDTYLGLEEGDATLESLGPHFLVVGQSDEASGRFHLRSSHSLVPYHDPFDGHTIAVGQAVSGTIDYPTDTDYYYLDLREGQTVNVVVDSTMIDPYLRLDHWGATSAEVASDDDLGGGLFGLNARLTYTAPHSDTYFVVIEDAEQEFGGYILTVEEAMP